jgi:hypothetical protein
MMAGRRYALIFWPVTATPWFVVLALLGAHLLGSSPLDATTVWLDALHHLTLLGPLAGWAVARRALGAPLPPRPAPLWALQYLVIYTVITLLAWGVAWRVPYLGAILVFVVPGGQLGVNLLWLHECHKHVRGVPLAPTPRQPAA